MIPSNIYVDLTREFNAGRLRAVICSGQAVVLHHLAVMSKDGDWILREDQESLTHVLGVLSEHGASYRFGAPLDVRWLQGGWSSHFEFTHSGLRVRTDFFTRPPRVDKQHLEALWQEQAGRDIPFVGLRMLADLKKTNREKDYAVIGELARKMSDPVHALLYSRSARDILAMHDEDPGRFACISSQRSVLCQAKEGLEALQVALDAERRKLIRTNETRLEAYMQAAEPWRLAWQEMQQRIARIPLHQAHELIVKSADTVLPREVLRGPRP